jgi:voltage-gated potassium channel
MSRTHADTRTFMQRAAHWGLAPPPKESPRAMRIEHQWRWPVMLVLLATIPAFYADLLHATSLPLADAAYLTGALVLALSLGHVSAHTRHPWQHLWANPTDAMLVLGLIAAALLPSSQTSSAALGLRLAVAFTTLLRMLWSVQHWINRGGVTYLLVSAVIVLLACGLGFWWLEPTTPTLAQGMWLAFTTAATVGYGDLVPTTAASKIFAVFVVLLGYGVLSLVTAAIATSWVETEERRIEREFLRDMRREMDGLRQELALLRETLQQQQRLPPFE